MASTSSKQTQDVVVLSELGQQITQQLSVVAINKLVYNNLSEVMDAESFGVGLYDEKEQLIDFPGYMEKGKVLSGAIFDLSDERLSSVCFNQDLEILIGDYETEAEKYMSYKPETKAGKTATSIIYLPIKIKGEKIGVITVQSFKENAFTEYHLNYLKSLGVYVAIALENARMYENMEKLVEERTREVVAQKEALEKSYEDVALLNKIGQDLISTFNLDEIFMSLHENVNKLMDATCFGIRLYDEERNVVVYKYDIEAGERDNEIIEVSMDDPNNLSVWSIKNKKPILINDLEEEYADYVDEIMMVKGGMTYSFVVQPLMKGEEVLGVIILQTYEKNAYTPHHLTILKTLASYAVIALGNAENFEESERTNENLALLNALGREITSMHSIEAIIKQVYNTINHHIALDSFGIGILDETASKISFPGYIENDEVCDDYSDDLEVDSLSTRCYKSKEIISVSSDKELQEFIGRDYQAGHEHRCESIIYVPMVIGDVCTGVLTVQSFKENAYSSFDLKFVENLASYVAVGLANAQSFDSLEKISQLGKEATSSHDLVEIGRLARESLHTMMPIESFIFCSYDEMSDLIEFVHIFEDNEEQDIPESLTAQDRKTAIPTCINEKRELIFRNAEEWKSEVEYMVIDGTIVNVNSLCFLPLIYGDKIMGVLSVQAEAENAYQKKHIEILRSVATTLSVAIHNARSYEDIRSMAAMTKSIATLLDLDEIGASTYNFLRKVMPVDSFMLGTYNKANEILEPVYAVEMDEPVEDLVGKVLGDDTLAGYVINNIAEVWTKENTDLSNYLKDFTPLTGVVTHSVVYVPILYLTEVIGVITIQTVEKDAYTDQQMEILRNVVSSLALALNNSRTHFKTMTIGKIGEEITTMLDANQISEHSYNRAQSVFKFNTFAVALFDSRKDCLVYRGMEMGEEMPPIELPVNKDSLAGYVFLEKKTVHLGEWKEAAEYIKIKIDRDEQVVSGGYTESIIYTPVMSQNKCIGVLTIQYPDAFMYSNEDAMLVENLASYVGAALANSTAFNNMELITNVGREVTSSFDLRKIADKLYHRIGELIDVDTFAVGTYDAHEDTVTYIRGYEDGEIFAELKFKIVEGEQLVGYCIRNKTDVMTSTAQDDLKYLDKVQPALEGDVTNSVIYVPLIFENRVLGVITIQSVREHAYDKNDLDIVKNLASYLSVALNNAKSHEALEHIGKIGQELSSITAAEEINQIAYKRLASVMTVDGFGIGIYNDATYTLDFPGYIEDGKVFDFLAQPLSEKRLGVICFKKHEIVHVSCVDDYKNYDLGDHDVIIRGGDTKSVIYVPMMLGYECVGVITVQAFDEHAYSKQDIAFIERLAPYVAVALQNAKSFSSIQSLGEISDVITSTFDLHEVIDRLYARILDLMPATTFYFATYHPERNQFVVAKQYQGEELIRENVALDILPDKSLFSYCLTKNDPLHLNHNKDLDALLPGRDKSDAYHKGEKNHSFLCVPVVYDSEVIGCISVQSTEVGVYSEQHFELFKNIASSVAIAMNNIRAYEEMQDAELQIRQKNEEIVDSINYAKHIQTAILPKNSTLKDHFEESFILFEPRDIVSGDFYWYRHFSAYDATILSVADCTGHGVPGGFMSMMGNELLNIAIGHPSVEDPAAALEMIDDRISKSLNDEHAEHHTRDGMDMTICVFIWSKKIIQFAGANRPLVRIRDDELTSFKPNKNGVGGGISEQKQWDFDVLDMKEGDCYYMYTDGFPDQFGGPKGKKFMRKRLNKLLLEIHKKSMEDQHTILSNTLEEWKSTHEQVDDICLMGVRI